MVGKLFNDVRPSVRPDCYLLTCIIRLPRLTISLPLRIEMKINRINPTFPQLKNSNDSNDSVSVLRQQKIKKCVGK